MGLFLLGSRMTQEIESIGLSMDTSGVEKGIKSLETLAATGPKVERAMGGVEGAAAKTGKTLANLGQGRAATGLNKVGEAAGGAAREMGRVSDASEQVNRGLSGVAANANLAARAVASIGIAATVQQYLRAADAVTTLNNSLKLATGSTQSAASAYEDLYQIAQRSRVSFLELGSTYSSIARATGELGVSQARMLKVTESIANAMAIGGGSAQSMNAALVQLSQGMASGTLRGEELNSILEQAPRLAKALADGLGVPIGKLREMGAAGEITSQQIVKALESQSAVLSKEVTGATITLGQAFTQLTNSGTKAVGEFDKASGASTTLAQAISSVAKSMDNLGTSFQNNAGTIQTVMGALAGATALTALAAIPRAIAAVTGAVSGLAAVLAANPVVLTLLGVGAAVGGGLAAVNAYSKTAEGIKSAVRSLEEANQRSEAAMQRALDGGRSAGADNIRKTIEERKKAIRDLNAELALMSNTSLDNRAEEARLAVGTEQYRAQQRAAEELAGIKQKLSGVDKDYLPTLNKLFKQYQDGNIELGEYQRLVAKLAKDNFKTDSGANSALSDALDAKLQAYKNNDKAILDSRKAFYDAQALLVKLGGKSELDAIDESLAKEEEVWAQRKANFEAELAQAAKKKTSQAEVARITGQMQDAERDYEQNIAKLRAESALADAKSLDALEARVAGQEKASRAAMEQVRMAELEGKAIGLTGDALRVFNQQQLESSIPLALKMQAAWADQAGALGDLGRAARDQIQAMRDLAKAQGENRAAQMVYEYAKGIEDSNRLLQAEIGLMGMSEQARTTALEQLRIQLDLEQKIAFVKANVADTDKQAADIAKLQASASIAKANAANKAFLDEWKTSVGKYDDIFRQGFADMLNNGKDGWKSFTRSLATTFKTTVADQLYKAFAQPFVVNIVGNLLGLTGALGLGGATGAAQGVLGGVSGLASGANVLTGLQGTTGILGNIGTFLGTNTVATNTAIATSLGIDAASASAAATGASAAGGGALGGLLSNPITMGLGAIAALSLLSKLGKGETRTGGQFGVSFDGTVTNQRRGETYTYQGQQFDRDFSNGQRNALIAGQAYRLEGDPVQNEQAIRDAVSGTASGINAFLKALGSKATLTGFSAGLETSGKGRGGVFAGGILSDGTTFGESGKGDNYAGTLYEAFSTNSPDFKTALENFTLDLKQSTIQALQSVTDIPETVKKMLKGVDAEGLGEEAANALLESINAQIVGVQNLTSAFDQMGMDSLAGIAFDVAAGLAEVSGGFDKLLSNLGTYYSNFFSPEEQRANMQRQLQDALSKLNLTLPDINATDARAQYRRLVEAAEKDLSEEGRKTYATLLQLAGAFAGITTAAEDAAQALERQRTSAYDLFKRAVDRDRNLLNDQATALRDTISGIGDVVGTLRDNARELYGTVDSTSQMLAAQGMVYIEQALGGVRAGGSVTDYTGLTDAISAARAGIDSGNYRNDSERSYEALVLAGQLTELGNLGDAQLTIEERQLRAITDQIEYLDTLAGRAEELVNGTTALTESVGTYFDRLLALLEPSKDEGKTPGATGGGGGFSIGGGSSGAPSKPGSGFFGAGGTEINDPATVAQLTSIRDFTRSLDFSEGNKSDAVGALAQAANQYGVDFREIAAATGYRPDDVARLFEEFGYSVPRFDVGTNYVPRDMFAVVHKGEQIVPAAYNPMLNPGVSQNTARLEALVERLTEEVAALRAAGEVTAQASDQTANVLTRVTNNGNGMITADAPI